MIQQPSSAAAWRAAGVRSGVRQAGDPPRWERCVYHTGATVSEFAAQHFGEPHRRVLLLGGAGFDPRTLTVARFLDRFAGGRLHGFFFREQRTHPDPTFRTCAENHTARLVDIVPGADVVEIDVFEDDGAVAVGRHAVGAVNRLDLGRYTDVVVDFSALSIGTSFPVTRLMLEAAQQTGKSPSINLHALVTASPTTDERIVPQPSDVVGPIHGFQGRLGIDETARAALLWMPQLRSKRRGMLERLFDYLKPHDVVPVLPFPAHDPRLGDKLIEHYAEELEGRWDVDARNIVYAAEGNPLDFYRTVLRIDDRRQPVFENTGGSLLVLSPLGTKVLALGAMMAAIERDLPVVYVEALSYTTSLDAASGAQYTEEDLVHVWLDGEAYPPVQQPDGTDQGHAGPTAVR